jgi:DNA-binding SARP family transcriptional activator
MAPQAEHAGYTVRLLGGFELREGDRTVTTSPSAQRLLAYVATRRATVNRSTAARALWPDYPDPRPTANLRSALWRLRREHRGGPILSTPRGLELRRGTVVDMHMIHAQATALSSAPATVGELDLAVLRQDVLPDWTDEWLLPTREWFRQIRLRALETLCTRHCRNGRFDAALEAGMAAVDCEPLRESAHRAIVRVHLAEGNPAEALRQYELYRQLAGSELGLRPSQQFRALIAHLLGRPTEAGGRCVARSSTPSGSRSGTPSTAITR